MCGLFGVCGPRLDNSNHNYSDALSWLKHRGPDSTQTIISDELFLGFHRLSITAVADKTADQPYRLSNGYYMLFNGEIFNFDECISIFKPPKYIKESLSDTHLLAYILTNFSLDYLNYVDGMFSIALIDPNLKRVQLIRDRYGVKPLYYFSGSNSIFAFSSHPTPLAMLSEHDLQPDLHTIRTYLETGLYDHTTSTFFADIKCVPPGSCMTINYGDSNSTTHSYWYNILNHIPTITKQFGTDDLHRLDQLFTEIFKDYIPNEVDYALNISGGVDSSLLVSKCYELTGKLPLLQNQHYDGDQSERPWINELTNLYNAKVDFHHVTPELILDDYKSTFAYQAQPFGGVTVIGYTPLYKNAFLNKIKVVLDGSGLDEVFLGYPRYYTNYQRDNTYWISSHKGATGPTDEKGIRPQAITSNLINTTSIISNDALQRLKPLHEQDPVRYLAFLDLFSFKIPRTLRFTDHASSRFSLELRSPFLSYKLIHYALGFSSNSFVNELGSKLPIREILRRKNLQKIANAPKRYVQSPQNVWIDNQLYSLLEPLLSNDALVYSFSILNPIAIRQEIEKYSSSSRANSYYLWQWLSLEIFLRNFFS